jgi:hypothetical protein
MKDLQDDEAILDELAQLLQGEQPARNNRRAR